jgi:dsDNA-binding SOS-regulon protein
MNQSTAIKKLTKILGKHFAYRVEESALTGADREAALATCAAARETREALSKALAERREAVLLADKQYQELAEHCLKAHERLQVAQGRAHSRRITVGTLSSMFFHVKAEADNWQEAVDIVTAKEAA